MARGGLGAADAVAPGQHGQVELQDAALAERALHLHRIQPLAQLAHRVAFVAGVDQLGELLGDRAGALQRLGLVLVALPHRDPGIELVAGVLEESLVLGGDHCVLDPALDAPARRLRAAARARVGIGQGLGAQPLDRHVGKARHQALELQALLAQASQSATSAKRPSTRARFASGSASPNSASSGCSGVGASSRCSFRPSAFSSARQGSDTGSAPAPRRSVPS